MKLLIHTLALLYLLSATKAQAQAPEWTSVEVTPPPGKAYFTQGAEWNFSLPVLGGAADGDRSVLRFAPVINLRSLLHLDASDHAGAFAGLSLGNVGFIRDVGNGTRFKYRTYTVGLPIGIKLGRMHGTLMALGYELELPFHYKEKRFVDERRDDRFGVWFSDRTSALFHSVFISVQGPAGTTLTLRYHLANFHRSDFVERKDGVEVRPYEGFRTNLLMASLGYGLFNGKRWHWAPAERSRDVQANLRP